MFSPALTAAALLFCAGATAQTTTLTTKPVDLSARPAAKAGATLQQISIRPRATDAPRQMSLMTVGPVIAARADDAPTAYRSTVAGSVDGNVSVTAGPWLAPSNPRARPLDNLLSRGAALPPVDLGPGPAAASGAARAWTETPLRVSSASASAGR